MTTVVCGACALKITSENDRVYCFGGCDQILHAKCSDLTRAGLAALKECASLRYVCIKCRKKQLCLNDVQNKCAEILANVSESKTMQTSLASSLKDDIQSLENIITERVSNNIKAWLHKELLVADVTKVANSAQNTAANRSYANVAVSGVILADSVTAVCNTQPTEKEGGYLRSGKRRFLGQTQTTTPTAKNNSNPISSNNTPNNNSAKSNVPDIPATPSRSKAVAELDETVMIKPKDPQAADVTEKDVHDKLDPVQFCVRNVAFLSNGAARIRCCSPSLAIKLVNSAKESLSDKYDIEILRPLRPRLKIAGFSKVMEPAVLLEKLRRQNDIPATAELEVIRLVTNEKLTKKSNSAIIETDAKTFASLLSRKRIYLGWECCSIMESVNVLRCFHCSEYGHTASSCTKPACCPKCAEDHEVNECVSDREKCVNCCIVNKEKKLHPDDQLDVCHSAWSSDCPIYRKRLKKRRQRIDYSS